MSGKLNIQNQGVFPNQNNTMAGIQEHYDTHLAQYYTWLFGGLEQKVQDNLQFFSLHRLHPAGSKRALDLGCGSGFQSLPLAEMGYEVVAVDISRELLRQLEEQKAGYSIIPVEADIIAYIRGESSHYELCVCMGDTLTHLESREAVAELIHRVYRMLDPGGHFVLTFRDYTHELHGEDRFIPVRSDEHTVFTCFLEYEPDVVHVHDIIYTRQEGHWSMAISQYTKIRLAPGWVEEQMRTVGFTLSTAARERGMVMMVGRKE